MSNFEFKCAFGFFVNVLSRDLIYSAMYFVWTLASYLGNTMHLQPIDNLVNLHSIVIIFWCRLAMSQMTLKQHIYIHNIVLDYVYIHMRILHACIDLHVCNYHVHNVSKISVACGSDEKIYGTNIKLGGRYMHWIIVMEGVCKLQSPHQDLSMKILPM